MFETATPKAYNVVRTREGLILIATDDVMEAAQTKQRYPESVISAEMGIMHPEHGFFKWNPLMQGVATHGHKKDETPKPTTHKNLYTCKDLQELWDKSQSSTQRIIDAMIAKGTARKVTTKKPFKYEIDDISQPKPKKRGPKGKAKTTKKNQPKKSSFKRRYKKGKPPAAKVIEERPFVNPETFLDKDVWVKIGGAQLGSFIYSQTQTHYDVYYRTLNEHIKNVPENMLQEDKAVSMRKDYLKIKAKTSKDSYPAWGDTALFEYKVETRA